MLLKFTWQFSDQICVNVRLFLDDILELHVIVAIILNELYFETEI